MQTRDRGKQSKEGEGEEKRDQDLENIAGNLLIAEYQVDKLRTRLADLVDGSSNSKASTMYSNTIINGINYHLK
jgi:hypothetical protein